jgi:hypothetical protein
VHGADIQDRDGAVRVLASIRYLFPWLRHVVGGCGIGAGRSRSDRGSNPRSAESPARWYFGLAAQGRGPKLVFLRALTTLAAGAAAQYEAEASHLAAGERNPADPYTTAVCYFNALRELGAPGESWKTR